MNRVKKNYMTLLEVLVAMTIFTVVMVILANMVYRVSQVTRKQKAQTDMYRDQRILMSVITQDLQSLVVSDDQDKEISCIFLSTPLVSGEYEYAGRFISNSGLGVTPGTDTSFMAEVFYCRRIFEVDGTTPIKKDTPLYRCIVTASPSNIAAGTWNFLGNPSGWGDAYGAAGVDTAVVATGVSQFRMDAIDPDTIATTPALLNAAGTKAPVYVTVTVELEDKGDTTGDNVTAQPASRVFTKRIFTNRGE